MAGPASLLDERWRSALRSPGEGLHANRPAFVRALSPQDRFALNLPDAAIDGLIAEALGEYAVEPDVQGLRMRLVVAGRLRSLRRTAVAPFVREAVRPEVLGQLALGDGAGTAASVAGVDGWLPADWSGDGVVAACSDRLWRLLAPRVAGDGSPGADAAPARQVTGRFDRALVACLSATLAGDDAAFAGALAEVFGQQGRARWLGVAMPENRHVPLLAMGLWRLHRMHRQAAASLPLPSPLGRWAGLLEASEAPVGRIPANPEWSPELAFLADWLSHPLESLPALRARLRAAWQASA